MLIKISAAVEKASPIAVKCWGSVTFSYIFTKKNLKDAHSLLIFT